MKQDTIERNNTLIKRQIDIDSDVYSDIEAETTRTNQRLGLVKRNEKKYVKDLIPELAADGLDFRDYKIYVPKIKGVSFLGDLKHQKLLQKVSDALSDLQEYHQSFLK